MNTLFTPLANFMINGSFISTPCTAYKMIPNIYPLMPLTRA